MEKGKLIGEIFGVVLVPVLTRTMIGGTFLDVGGSDVL